MGRILTGGVLAVTLMLAGACAPAKNEPAAAAAAKVPYGSNKAAGATFVHDGVSLYYEVYGEGSPLLVIHGNGGSIVDLSAQIDHFKAGHKVIAMDGRDQGRSGDSSGPLTYEKMADDQAALLDHLGIQRADVLGWSDGGIEALLLGVRHPDKVGKLVAMAANLNPKAIYPETDKVVRDMLAAVPEADKQTPQVQRELKVTSIMLTEPHIDPALLGKVAAPTLVLASDHDLITLEHTVEIFNHLPNAQLAIFPNSTHLVPFDDPQLFNATVDRFLTTPFKKIDRISDTMASLERMRSAQAAK